MSLPAHADTESRSGTAAARASAWWRSSTTRGVGRPTAIDPLPPGRGSSCRLRLRASAAAVLFVSRGRA